MVSGVLILTASFYSVIRNIATHSPSRILALVICWLVRASSQRRTVLLLPFFARLFRAFGLPGAFRPDNGVPFASPMALFGLSMLAVWWLQLGIAVERIKPGNPQQNGRHERMHLTLKKEATQPASFNFLQQQSRFDNFVDEFNHDRPHHAIGMKYPGELYTPSVKEYAAPESPEYPFHDLTIQVTHCGRICIHGRKINLSSVFAGQFVGIR